MFQLLGICLALAALVTFNALASLLAAFVWLGLRRATRRWSARSRAGLVFALRTFPITGALIAVCTLLIPAYVMHEPRSSVEVVSTKLALLAAVSIFGLALAVRRGLAAWYITRRLVADWLRYAQPVRVEGVRVPAYRIRHTFPVIAIVGTFSPRLFIAEQIFDTLSDEEICAAVAHERGHLTARDNLKRALLRACRDVLSIVPCGRSLDRAWAEEAEAAADEFAASTGATAALNLAGALIKIARIAPAGTAATLPAGSFMVEPNEGGIDGRVLRLVRLASDGGATANNGALQQYVPLVGLAAFLVLMAFTATSSRALTATHYAIEHVVEALN